MTAINEKLVTLAKRLHARADAATWEKTDEDGTYETEFAGFAVQVSESDDEEPIYSLRIFDEAGVLLDEVTDEDLTEILNQSGPAEPSVMFTVMQDIHRAARRSAMGVDKAIDAILNALEE